MSNSNEPPFLPGDDEIYDGEDLNAKQVAKDARALLSSVETLINTGEVEPKRQVGDMKAANSTMTTRRSRRALRKQSMVSKEQLNAIDENPTPRIQALAGSREFWETLCITIWLLDNAEYQSYFTDIHLTTIDMCMKTVQRTMNEVGEEYQDFRAIEFKRVATVLCECIEKVTKEFLTKMHHSEAEIRRQQKQSLYSDKIAEIKQRTQERIEALQIPDAETPCAWDIPSSCSIPSIKSDGPNNKKVFSYAVLETKPAPKRWRRSTTRRR